MHEADKKGCVGRVTTWRDLIIYRTGRPQRRSMKHELGMGMGMGGKEARGKNDFENGKWKNGK
jgi:hypothetical protein